MFLSSIVHRGVQIGSLESDCLSGQTQAWKVSFFLSGGRIINRTDVDHGMDSPGFTPKKKEHKLSSSSVTFDDDE